MYLTKRNDRTMIYKKKRQSRTRRRSEYMSTIEATVSMLQHMSEPEQNKVLMFTRDLFSSQTSNPFKPLSEKEFLASIDVSLKQADTGNVQDAEAAIDEISTELGI